MIIADSDVLIDYLHDRGAAARVGIELTTRSFATTAVTAFELRSGARSKKQRDGVEALLGAMTILSFGPEEAKKAAEVRQHLEADGAPIGMADYMVAAICLLQRGTLLTRNVKHFGRVPGLRLSSAHDG